VTDHNALIATAAKAALGPLGFRRMGRSRTWLADHGWWLTVVEFRPSAWERGSYLNVAAHWLWGTMGVVTLDYGQRVGSFLAARDEPGFRAGLPDLSASAASEAQALMERFGSVAATAEVLLRDEDETPAPQRGSWLALNAGVAAGLAGMVPAAARMFQSIGDTRVTPHMSALVATLGQPEAFAQTVRARIGVQRAALRLKPFEGTIM